MPGDDDPTYWCTCPPWVRECDPGCPTRTPIGKRPQGAHAPIPLRLHEKGATSRCPKCHCVSGDNWEQCNGACPLPISPHYDEMVEHAFQVIPLPRE